MFCEGDPGGSINASIQKLGIMSKYSIQYSLINVNTCILLLRGLNSFVKK